jgi:uncharacterized protein (TIGR03437 family)
MRNLRLLTLCTAICPLFGAAPTPIRLPLRFEATSGGSLSARQGPFGLVVSAGQSTVTVTDRARRRSASVVTRFAGASTEAHPEGAVPLGATANYLLGSDPAQWRTGVPLYARAVYRGIYPAIDLVFHGDGGSLEYDFLARPGSHPRAIALDLSGAEALRLEADGALAIDTAAGTVRWKKPVAYQWRDGQKQPVDAAFRVHGRRVTFALGAYDRGRELVIDPTLAYASYLGGSNDDASRGVAVDSSGNFYITGFTFSLNLPHTTASSYQASYRGGSALAYIGGDAYVAKFASSGALVYVTYLGGSGDDSGMAVAADANGNAYVTGYTASSNFPTTLGALQTGFGGASAGPNYSGVSGDAFVTKLNSTGTALVYSTYLGGLNDDFAASIAVDASGNAFIGGATKSTNFPRQNAAQATYGGAGGNPGFFGSGSDPLIDTGDGFVAKLNAAGSALLWSTYLGGTSDDAVAALAIDGSGAVYVGGTTLSTKFPVTSGAYQTTYGGTLGDNSQPVIKTGDGFIAKYDSTGKLVYATYLGGSGDDAVMGVAVDSTGAAYAAGFTSSSNLATGAVVHGTFHGPGTITGSRGFVWGDAFAAKLAPSGGSLAYLTYVGGSQDDAAMAIAVDATGAAIIGGFANSTDMQLSSDALQKTYGGNLSGFTDDTGDAFIAKISADGATVLYNSYFGGKGDEAITGIAIDNSGNVIAAGSTTSANLATTINAAQPAFGGQNSQDQTETMGDAFVTVFANLASAATGPVITSVVNGASFDTRLAPGSAAAVTGTNLPTSSSAGAMVGGLSAQVVSASATQWSIVIPAGAVAGSTTLQIGTSAPFGVTLSQYAPALYSTTNNGTGTVKATRGSAAIGASNPALPGDSIAIFGTGFGSATAANTTVVLAGTQIAATSLAAVSGQPGQYQVVFVVPASIAAGNQNTSVSVAGQSSNTLTLPVASVSTSGPVVTAVQSAASFQDGVAANAWVAIKGSNLATVAFDTWSNAIVNGQFPTTLDGVSVTIGGQPAYINYVTPTQINAVAPNIAPGPVTVVVQNSLGTSAAFSTNALAAQPAFFVWPGGYVAATYPDYTLAVKNGTFSGATTVAAHPGDVLILWGTGFGPTTPAAPVGSAVPATATYSTATPVTVTIGSAPATIYGAALASGYAALFQVAIQVPSSLANGDYPLVATVNGVSSPATALITVQQ